MLPRLRNVRAGAGSGIELLGRDGRTRDRRHAARADALRARKRARPRGATAGMCPNGTHEGLRAFLTPVLTHVCVRTGIELVVAVTGFLQLFSRANGGLTFSRAKVARNRRSNRFASAFWSVHTIGSSSEEKNFRITKRSAVPLKIFSQVLTRWRGYVSSIRRIGHETSCPISSAMLSDVLVHFAVQKEGGERWR